MERRGVPAPRTNDQGFSAFAPSAPDHVHGPSSPGAAGGTSGLGAAAAAIADIERQLERLITQRKTERLAAARAIGENGENGNNDQRKKAKTGAATREEDKDSSSTESAASDAQSTKRRNLDEDLLIGMLGIPFVSSEVARGRSPRPHSSPTMSTSPPMTPAPTAHHTSLTPDVAANAADLVLRADLGQGDKYRDTPPAIATESVWQAAEATHKPPSPPLRSFTSAPAPPLPEQQLQPVVVAAALRREIMGEVKTELLMEVARRDKENQGKLYELELENRELKQELHGLLREMREDRRRKEREREERKKRRQRSAGQRTKRGRGGSDDSDDSEGSDIESSDDDTISSSSSNNQEVAEPKRRGTKRSRGGSDREPADRHSDTSDTNSSKRKRGKASVAPARKAERHAGEVAAGEADVQQRRAQTTEPAVPLLMTPLRADTRGSPKPRADRWSHSSGSGGEETTAAATGPDEDRNTDDGGTPSRSTMWRRKKGHRAAEEIEHDNQERWQMRVDQLRAFAKEHGHCRVPKNHPNRPLYTWTQNVRQRWRRGAVPESKIRDLVALGMQHPTDEFGGAAARRGPLQRPPVEPATEEDVDTSRDQDSKAVDRKSSTSSTGRPRAVKRSRREKRPPSATTKAEGGEDVKRPQQSRASDDDYAALSEKDHEDDEEEEEEEEEEREEKYTRRLRQRQPRRSEEAKPHTNAADGVVTRRRAKSLTSQAEEPKEPARGEKRKPTTTGSSTDADKETKSPKKKAKLAERKSEGEDAKSQKQQKKKPSIDESEEEESAKRSDYEDDEEGAGSEGDEIPESHVNHKWLQHFEELKAWQKQHNLSRPNRKQSASLGRWSDEQLNRMRSGMLLPWRRKLLDATGFFASTTESS